MTGFLFHWLIWVDDVFPFVHVRRPVRMKHRERNPLSISDRTRFGGRV